MTVMTPTAKAKPGPDATQPGSRGQAPPQNNDRLLPWSYIGAAGISGASVAVLLWRSRHPWLRTSAAVAVACYSVGTHLRTANQLFEERRLRPARRQVLTCLAAAFDAILQTSIFRATDFGVSAFSVHKGPLGDEFLQRVGNVRLAQLPSSSGVIWTPGKGVIGGSWKEDSIVICNLAAHHAPYRTAEDWSSAPAEVQMGLTWDEAQSLAARYAGVIAVPYHRPNGTVGGIVTLDVLIGADFSRFLAARTIVEETVVALASAASLIETVLDEDRGTVLP